MGLGAACHESSAVEIDEDSFRGAVSRREEEAAAEGARRRQFRLEHIFRQRARHLRRIARMMRPQLLGFRAGPGDCHIVRPSSALTSVARERMIDSWQFPQP